MAILKRGSSTITKETLFSMGEQYAVAAEESKKYDGLKKKLSDKIKEGVAKLGVLNDKGSSYIESDTLILGRVAKVSQSFNVEKAVEVLTAAGLQDCIDTVTTQSVNEDRLAAAVQEGRITMDMVKSFTDTKTTYSVSVQRKTAMPEVKQSDLAMAASRKS